MWFINFGEWSSSSGRCFIAERLYWKGWTPFVRYRKRYKKEPSLKSQYEQAAGRAQEIVDYIDREYFEEAK